MFFRLIAFVLAVAAVRQALAQDTCQKRQDCVVNAICNHTNYYDYPTVWPPCAHGGSCECLSGFAKHSNSSCMPFVQRNLNDACSGFAWEIIRSPEHRCSGGKVVCNTPTYRLSSGNNFCELVPVPPVVVPDVVPPVVPPVGPVCQTVSWLSHCDGAASCCQAGVGLHCTQRGRNTTFNQCLCSLNTQIFDRNIGYCRDRMYGDTCLFDEDCNSKYISNAGYECRLGRCRCKTGYEPYDNTYFNQTTKTPYTWRICLINTATTWVPTGQSCTMNPEQYADSSSTRACQTAAFCHQCRTEQSGGSGGSVATTGTCRELTCTSGRQCGSQGTCNNWGMQLDPPCANGMCDCNWANGFYKDRFSRCDSYRQMRLGDRCIVPDGTTQLHSWYPNNEDWAATMECVAVTSDTGYAGYNMGIIKCKFPLIEDKLGGCVRNDANQDQWYRWLSLGSYCDDTDYRLPLKRCNNATGLQCVNNRCNCPSTMTCEGFQGACQATTTGGARGAYWDGAKCRARGIYGDRCNTTSDCCGGTCIQGVCGCNANYQPLRYSTQVDIQNGDNRISINVVDQLTCFRNASVVGKGSPCHLDPRTWDCNPNANWRYGHVSRNLYTVTRVCSQGLVCMRCPADFVPEDVSLGVCRAVSRIAETHPVPNQCADSSGTPSAQGNGYIPRNWYSAGAITFASHWLIAFFLAAAAAL